MVTEEIEKFKNEFVHILNEKNEIIDSQARKLAEHSIQVQLLQIEKSKIEQNRLYACEVCDFESEEKQYLTSHKQNDH